MWDVQSEKRRVSRLFLSPNGDGEGIWSIITKVLPIQKSFSARRAFRSVMALASTCSGLRVLCCRQFHRWWAQHKVSLHKPANLEAYDSKSLLFLAKLCKLRERGESFSEEVQADAEVQVL